MSGQTKLVVLVPLACQLEQCRGILRPSLTGIKNRSHHLRHQSHEILIPFQHSGVERTAVDHDATMHFHFPRRAARTHLRATESETIIFQGT